MNFKAKGYLILLLFSNAGCQSGSNQGPGIPQVLTGPSSTYRLFIKDLQKEAVGSYPQKILSVIRTDSGYIADIETFTPYYSDSLRRTRILTGGFSIPDKYPHKVRDYLRPTNKTQSDSPIIDSIAEAIVPHGTVNPVKIAELFLGWIQNNIRYDEVLADSIGKGTAGTRSALETIKPGKVTCSEYTNVFISLMRNRGIPARFITGILYVKGESEMYHAWAEYYVESIGWIAVDPQNASFWLPDWGIKLYANRDFESIGHTLPEIDAMVEKIN